MTTWSAPVRTAIALPSPVVAASQRDRAVCSPLVRNRKGQLGDVNRRMHGGVRENADAERGKPMSKCLHIRLLVGRRQDKRAYVAKLLDLGGRLRDRARSEDHARAKPGKDKRPNRCHVRSILMCRCARRLTSWTAYIRSFVSVRPPR